MLRLWLPLLFLIGKGYVSDGIQHQQDKIESEMTYADLRVNNTRDCDLVLRYVEEFGVGVYAGKLFSPGSIVERNVGIPIPSTLRAGNELDLYVEFLNETHDIIPLGNALMLNHATVDDGRMLAFEFDYESKQVEFKYSRSASVDIEFTNLWTVFPGDQLFLHYGDIWFSSRGLDEISVRTQLNRDILHVDDVFEDVGRLPGCSTLLTRLSEDGVLVAAADIFEGEYVEVCRALLIPQNDDLFESGPLAEYVWFKPAPEPNVTRFYYEFTTRVNMHVDAYDPYAEYAIVLLGNGLLYGASSADGSTGKIPNVDYDWWDVEQAGVIDDSIPDVLETRDADMNDMVCQAIYPTSSPFDQRDDDSSGFEASSKVISDHDQDLTDETKPCRKNYRRTRSGTACRTRMFVSFVANRYIYEGEELIVDLDQNSVGNRYPRSRFGNQCM